MLVEVPPLEQPVRAVRVMAPAKAAGINAERSLFLVIMVISLNFIILWKERPFLFPSPLEYVWGREKPGPAENFFGFLSGIGKGVFSFRL